MNGDHEMTTSEVETPSPSAHESSTLVSRHIQRAIVPARAAALDLSLLTGFWLFFFWEILVKRDHVIPYDLLDQHYMFQQFIHASLRHGSGVWWTPNILSGYPIIADPLSALFYPPNLMMHLLVRRDLLPYLALEAQSALHFLWAAVGMYLLARFLTNSRAGAMVAALSWAFGAFFVWHMTQLSPISSLSWLPWVLLALAKVVQNRSLIWTATGALAFGMLALAGHAFTILETAYLVTAITALMTWRQWRSDRRNAIVVGLCGAAIVSLGAGIAMVQLLPSWYLSSLTERANFTYQAATTASYMPHWLVTAVLPNFFSYDGPASYWASGDPAETNMYLGLLPLSLALLGTLRCRREDRRIVALLASGGLLALVLSFGSHAWLYRIAFDILPGVDRVRRPGDLIAVFQLAVALLAAFGVRSLQEPDIETTNAHVFGRWLRGALLVNLVALAGTALALAALYGQPSQQTLITVLNGMVFAGVVLLAACLVIYGHQNLNLGSSAALALLVVVTAVDLGSSFAGSVYRNSAGSPNAYVGTNWASGPSDQAVPGLIADQRQALPDRFRLYPEQTASVWANGELVWGLESASGYVVLCPRYYCALLNAAIIDPGSRLFDLLNVRYYLTGKPIEQLYPRANLTKFRLVMNASPYVYENVNAVPRVWIAQHAVIEPEDDAALSYLEGHPESLQDTVVIDEQSPAHANAAGSPGMARIVDYRNTSVSVSANLATGGYVVLEDTYFPGWQVRVDGKPTHVYRADLAFRAVWVPAGTHRIEYSYHQPGLRLSVAVSILSLAAVAILLLAGIWSSVKSRSSDRHDSHRKAAKGRREWPVDGE